MSGSLQAVFANQRGFVAVPGAPSIGTATATGPTSATVTYTAPASDGGSVITSYTATSSPSGITGTLSQAGSGTITVSGLAFETAYTFTVKATNAIGQSAASSASNSITTTALGDAYGGGYFAGQISTSANGVATHNLVISDKSVGQNENIQWGTNPETTGATSFINGPANSATESSFGAAYYPARFCETLNTGGYTDWYLGARNEMTTIYYFLKPTTTTNSTSYGSNSNAVSPQPLNTNYTSGSPAQTSVSAFQSSSGSQFVPPNACWTSTELDENSAYSVNFGDGFGAAQNKSSAYKNCRAIRRVAI
jgi:hypothetical protein